MRDFPIHFLRPCRSHVAYAGLILRGITHSQCVQSSYSSQPLCSRPSLLGKAPMERLPELSPIPAAPVLANAAVEVSNKANGQVYSAVSTSTGNYTVPQLPVSAL